MIKWNYSLKSFNVFELIKIICHISRIKDKNHVIISRDAEKAFNKIQHTFMIKTIKKLCVEGTYLNTINTTYEKYRAKIRLNGEKLKSFPLRSRTRQGCPFLLFLFSIVLTLKRNLKSK